MNANPFLSQDQRTPVGSVCFSAAPAQPVGSFRRVGLLLALTCCAGVLQAETVTCPVVSDTVLFAAPGPPSHANLGAARTLPLLGPNSFALLRFDLGPLGDQRVVSAKLRVHRAENHLVRVGVSTVASPVPWHEGNAEAAEEEHGAPCFRYAVYSPDRSTAVCWGRAGGTFRDVSFGDGGSRWRTIAPHYDHKAEWYEIDIPPAWIDAMRAGLQAPAIALADDFNRLEVAPLIHSRESSFPPALVVDCAPGTPDTTPASAVPTLSAVTRDALGREWVTIQSDPDVIGWEIVLLPNRATTESALARAARLPMYELAAPAETPRQVLLSRHRTAAHRFVAVRGCNAARRWSEWALGELPAPAAGVDPPALAELKRYPLPTPIERPIVFDAGPALSEDGHWIRSAAQTWWDPTTGPVRLQLGRNEFDAFQVALAGGPGDYAVTLTPWEAPGAAAPAPQFQLYRQHYVQSRLGTEKYAPDPLLPLPNGARLTLDLESPAQLQQLTSQPARRKAVQSVWVDVYVPAGAASGTWRARLIVTYNGTARLDVPIELTVSRVALPNALSYPVSLRTRQMPFELAGLPENSTAAWEALRRVHRVAHAARVTFAPVPYRIDGSVYDEFAPRIDVKPEGVRLEWSAWDQRFGGLLDGAAFRDLPREGEPLDHMILPVHENWPVVFRPEQTPPSIPLTDKYHYRTTRTVPTRGVRPNPRPTEYLWWPPERCVGPDYAAGMQAVLQQWQAHFAASRWKTTCDVLFLNPPSGRAGASWWLLEEPQIIDDTRGLAFLLRAAGARGEAGSRIRFSAQLGAPDPVRDLLRGLLHHSVLHDAFLMEHDRVVGQPERIGDVWTYHRDSDPEYGWSKIVAQGWADRLAGARGVVAPASLGGKENWEKAGTAALILPSLDEGNPEVYATARLFAFRRLQQDAEWLAQFVACHGEAPEGYAVSAVGTLLAARAGARPRDFPSLLPVLQFPGRLDTVAFEEVRRALRSVADRAVGTP